MRRSTRRRDRVGNERLSPSAEQMDARYARGRTALVRRRKWFHGPKTVRWAFLALCLLIFSFLFLLNGFLPILSRPSLATPGPRQTSRAIYQPDAPLGSPLWVLSGRGSRSALPDGRPTAAVVSGATIDSASLAEHHSSHDHVQRVLRLYNASRLSTAGLRPRIPLARKPRLGARARASHKQYCK